DAQVGARESERPVKVREAHGSGSASTPVRTACRTVVRTACRTVVRTYQLPRGFKKCHLLRSPDALCLLLRAPKQRN
ncbi:unnamed protein product, partial [Rangifer tarandus platyrhynchus]